MAVRKIIRMGHPTLRQVARNVSEAELGSEDLYASAYHHMGGCGMGDDPASSVVDSVGRVHDSPNLFVAGGSNFTGASGGVNPTLTMVALALRTSDYILDRVL